jgi:hypothetical protein
LPKKGKGNRGDGPRAVEVLERAGDSGRAALETLAQGPDGEPLAEDARAALRRVKQRTGEP